MTPQLWIGLGFLAALVIFLFIAYFAKDRDTQNQSNILRFLMALSAGFAGGFLSGDALFKLDSQMSDSLKLTISGTAGCALFFTIWLTRNKQQTTPPPPDTFNFSILNGWTFEVAIRTIIKAAKGVVDIKGFTTEQLSLILQSTELKNTTAKEALEKLKYLNSNIPDYMVNREQDNYVVQTK